MHAYRIFVCLLLRNRLLPRLLRNLSLRLQQLRHLKLNNIQRLLLLIIRPALLLLLLLFPLYLLQLLLIADYGHLVYLLLQPIIFII